MPDTQIQTVFVYAAILIAGRLSLPTFRPFWRGIVFLWRSIPQWPVIRHYRVRRIRKKAQKAAKLRAAFRVYLPEDEDVEEQEIKEGDPDHPEGRESA